MLYPYLSISIIIIIALTTDAKCPPSTLINPCICFPFIPSHRDIFFGHSENIYKHQRSILCENITNNNAVNLQKIFINLISSSKEYQHFDSFLLRNTTLREIPSNIFSNITFLTIQLEHNIHLSTIDPNAFTNTNEHVLIFETLNTNLSEKIFSNILNKFVNIIRISMLNDNVQRIPSNVFNQSKLERLWFGIEGGFGKQPLKSIDQYAFYHLPQLSFLRIMSDHLAQFNKYSFALEKRCDEKCHPLEIFFGGSQLSSKSFPLTSLTRFRSRTVYLRFFQTINLNYLDEAIFQPFLESGGSNSKQPSRRNSIINISSSNVIRGWGTESACPCQMKWIQRDYFHPNTSSDLFDNRVYGYPCWDYDFSNCTDAK